MIQPTAVLLAGVKLLDPILVPHGFEFLVRNAGKGSGGESAWGEYVRGDQRLEMHFRYSLGLVTYHAGELCVDHESYLRALGVPSGASQYPGFSDDPLDGFRHLAHDLRQFCGDFLKEDATILRLTAPAEMARDAAEWTRENATWVDAWIRHAARRHFRAGEYERVVTLFSEVQHPERLTDVERRMLEIASSQAAG